jgi:hypothetical protein
LVLTPKIRIWHLVLTPKILTPKIRGCVLFTALATIYAPAATKPTGNGAKYNDWHDFLFENYAFSVVGMDPRTRLGMIV